MCGLLDGLDALTDSGIRTDGKIVLIVVNDANSTQDFCVRYRGKSFHATLKKGAVVTYVW